MPETAPSAEDDYEAHDAGFIVPDIEDQEALTDACTGCGATKSDDGWTYHPSDCPRVALSPEAKARIGAVMDEVERKVIRVR